MYLSKSPFFAYPHHKIDLFWGVYNLIKSNYMRMPQQSQYFDFSIHCTNLKEAKMNKNFKVKEKNNQTFYIYRQD